MPSPSLTREVEPSTTSLLPPPAGHQLNTGIIVAIALSAFAVLLASAITLFLLFCRRGHAQRSRKIEVHTHRGRWSRRLSSVWTGLGSVSVDPCFDSSESLWRHSDQVGCQVANPEKLEPGASACTSPTPTEVRPLVQDTSVHSLHEGVALQASSTSLGLLALTGIAYTTAKPVNHDGEKLAEWRRSGASRVTASSGGVQSVEAL
uniref:Uncharacterized protein n=1 Tax=Ganoderma boninense TaxID=34458 RepID=A0A5K1JYP0_9APHY|nr:Uncharacterized protein [Ganoderma boninense]